MPSRLRSIRVSVRPFFGVHGCVTPLAVALLLPSAAGGWQTTLEASRGGQAYVLAVDDRGDAVAGGVIYGSTAEDESFTVVKLRSTDGNQIWRYGGPAPQARAVALDGDDVIAAGFFFYTPESGSSGMVVRLSGATGQEIWRVNRPGSFVAPSLVVDSAGDVIVAEGAGDGQSVTVEKLSGMDGTVRWRRTLPRAWSAAMILEATGDVVVAATPIVALAGETGDVRWTADVLGDRVSTLLRDEAGDPVVGTFFFQGPPGREKYHTRIVRLSRTTGRIRWGTGPTNLFPVLIRGSREIIAVRTMKRRRSEHQRLVALRRRDGRPTWRHGLRGDTYVSGATVDAVGDLFVSSAYEDGGAGQYPPLRSRITKLRGRNGAPLWKREFDGGSPFGAFVGQAVGTDGHRDVVIAGYGVERVRPMTFKVIKLDGTTGANSAAQRLPDTQ